MENTVAENIFGSIRAVSAPANIFFFADEACQLTKLLVLADVSCYPKYSSAWIRKTKGLIVYQK